MSPDTPRPDDRIPSGVPGLDEILHGGIPRDGLHLLTGPAGSGKTTLALQFLLQGAAEGASTLFLTLSQNERDLKRIARSHGFTLDGVEIRELASHDIWDLRDSEQTVFHTSEVELRETMTGFIEAVDQVRPQRVVFDSVAELRLLAGNGLSYRRRVLALRQYLGTLESTMLLLQPTRPDPSHPDEAGDPMRDLADGVIELSHAAPPYGQVRRSLKVSKMRGATFVSGDHSMAIRTGGVQVFPRLAIATPGQEGQESERTSGPAIMSSGVEGLDDVLGGGLEAGTSSLVLGPAGSGKSTLVTSFAHAAAERGEGAAVFLFEERPEMFLDRSEQLGKGLRSHVRDGRVVLRLIDTGEVSAGEFAYDVMRQVDRGATVVGIDSLTSYYHAMRNQDLLVTQLHELLMNLSRRGVLTLLTVGQHGIVGSGLHGPDVSYLADNLMLLRHFEARGTLRKALSVVKRRYGPNDPALRELHISGQGILVGDPLREFRGILTGSPVYEGDGSDLIGSDDSV